MNSSRLNSSQARPFSRAGSSAEIGQRVVLLAPGGRPAERDPVAEVDRGLARSPPLLSCRRSASICRCALDLLAVHHEQALRRGDGLRPHRAGGAAVIDVERLQEVRHDVAVGGEAADHVGPAAIRLAPLRPCRGLRRPAAPRAADVEGRAADGQVEIAGRASGSNPRSARLQAAAGGSCQRKRVLRVGFEIAASSTRYRSELASCRRPRSRSAVHLLHAEPASDELGRQPVEQCGWLAGRPPKHAEVAGGSFAGLRRSATARGGSRRRGRTADSPGRVSQSENASTRPSRKSTSPVRTASRARPACSSRAAPGRRWSGCSSSPRSRPRSTSTVQNAGRPSQAGASPPPTWFSLRLKLLVFFVSASDMTSWILSESMRRTGK